MPPQYSYRVVLVNVSFGFKSFYYNAKIGLMLLRVRAQDAPCIMAMACIVCLQAEGCTMYRFPCWSVYTTIRPPLSRAVPRPSAFGRYRTDGRGSTALARRAREDSRLYEVQFRYDVELSVSGTTPVMSSVLNISSRRCEGSEAGHALICG